MVATIPPPAGRDHLDGARLAPEEAAGAGARGFPAAPAVWPDSRSGCRLTISSARARPATARSAAILAWPPQDPSRSRSSPTTLNGPPGSKRSNLPWPPRLGGFATGGIHHVGSTAVPSLDAKPIIDILVGVESLDASQPAFGPLARLDYMYAPYLADEMHWFCKPNPSRRTHHLHLEA